METKYNQLTERSLQIRNLKTDNKIKHTYKLVSWKGSNKYKEYLEHSWGLQRKRLIKSRAEKLQPMPMQDISYCHIAEVLVVLDQ